MTQVATEKLLSFYFQSFGLNISHYTTIVWVDGEFLNRLYLQIDLNITMQ